MFSNGTYDKLKWVAQYLLPALGTLVYGICTIWGLPYGEEIVGSIVILDTFLGGLLGISSLHYNGDGTMIVDTSNPEKDIYRMELNDPLETITDKDKVIFKVKTPKHMTNVEYPYGGNE